MENIFKLKHFPICSQMEQIAILSSSKDPAGINIRNALIRLFHFAKTEKNFDGSEVFVFNKIPNKTIKSFFVNDDLIFLENIDKKISADIFIFASKHRSKENTPSFAVHPIGNWNKAEFGGKEKTLCFSSAILLKNIFVELNKNFILQEKNFSESNYEITLEATHHGPYVEKPAVFVEIGSTENEWSDEENGKIIAKTIINALNNSNTNYKIAVGIGGPHYCNNFNKIMLRTDIAISHICPKYHLETLDEELIKQAIEKTIEKVDFVVLDWKGLGTEKQRIVEMLNNMNMGYIRTDQILY